jgi:transposase
MISFSFPAEIYIANKPTDFRKCFDGLCGEIQSYLQSDPLSGALFVFYNKRRDRLKMIIWDNDGFWMFYKRLEQGTFEIPGGNSDKSRTDISAEQLQLMLCGIELSSIRKRKRFELQQKHQAGKDPQCVVSENKTLAFIDNKCIL